MKSGTNIMTGVTKILHQAKPHRKPRPGPTLMIWSSMVLVAPGAAALSALACDVVMVLHMIAAVMAMIASMMSRKIANLRCSGRNSVKVMMPKAKNIEVMSRPAAAVT